MIARIWRGAVRSGDSDAYAEYMQRTGIADYAATEGNRGVWMLMREVGDREGGQRRQPLARSRNPFTPRIEQFTYVRRDRRALDVKNRSTRDRLSDCT